MASNTTPRTSGRIDVHRLKADAAGRELEILREVAGIPAELLDGQHHACPRCGGTDRFRLVDESVGAVLCNQCFTGKNGDFIAAVMWATGWAFPETLQRIAEYLGLQVEPPAGKPATSLAEQFTRLDESQQSAFIRLFCMMKPPIQPEAVVAAGGIAVRWPAKSRSGDSCIAWPALNDKGEVVGWILRQASGAEFPAIGKLQARKTHMIRGSKDGWVIPGGLERLRAARVVWKCEGVPDAISLHPHLPADHVAVSNIAGSKSVPPYLQPFRGKVVYIVADSDQPGQEGAERYAAKLAPLAAEVRIVNLPHEVARG